MNQEELKNNLKNFFNIETSNCYPKKSFLRNGIPTIGCFHKEIETDFYWYNDYNDKYYKLPRMSTINTTFEVEHHNGADKYQIPCSFSIELKQEGVEEYKELEDAHVDELTIRDLAAILWKKPVSNQIWLNNLIKEYYF